MRSFASNNIGPSKNYGSLKITDAERFSQDLLISYIVTHIIIDCGSWFIRNYMIY